MKRGYDILKILVVHHVVFISKLFLSYIKMMYREQKKIKNNLYSIILQTIRKNINIFIDFNFWFRII